jgi:hypothetical protein
MSRIRFTASVTLLVFLSASLLAAQAWKPYSFKGTEHFKYTIESTEKGGEKKTGFFTLDLKPTGEDQYKVSFESKLGENEASSSTTASSDELAGKLMMTMMMSGSEAGAILGITLFTQALPMIFMGMSDLDVGSGWTRTENGKEISFKVEGKEKIAGVEGYRCVFREADQVKFQHVISPDVALPLMTEMVDDDGSRHVSKLVEYGS